MPFLTCKKSNNSHKIKKAFIATTPKQAFDYNYILCYLRILCRKAFGKFISQPNAAVKGSVSRGEENKNKGREGFGGVADANTRLSLPYRDNFCIEWWLKTGGQLRDDFITNSQSS